MLMASTADQPNQTQLAAPESANQWMTQGMLGYPPPHTLTTRSPSSLPLSPACPRVVFQSTCPPGQGIPLNLVPVQPVPAQQEDHPARRPVRQLDFTAMYDGTCTSVDTSIRPMTIRNGSPPKAPTIRPALFDTKEGTPNKGKQCNCKNSRCLKLYCECFASGTYCDGCNCVNCCNNAEKEAVRKTAIEATLERNPTAFRPKIASRPGPHIELRIDAGEFHFSGKHNKGCQCKKSGCLKKYCECFQAGIFCSDNCKCMDCKNSENSDERRALCNAAHMNYTYNPSFGAGSLAYISPLPLSKKQRRHDLVYVGQESKDQVSFQRPHLVLQPGNVKTASVPLDAPVTCIPAIHETKPALPTSKVSYGSLLMGVVQPDAVRELCKLLVMVSAGATKAFAENNLVGEASTEKDTVTVKDGVVSMVKNHDESNNHVDCCAEEERGEKCSAGQASNANIAATDTEVGADAVKERAMSPGTVALMCDEQDTSPASPSGVGFSMQRSPILARAFAEQEKAVLSEFRDCLRRIVSVGNKRATHYSSNPAWADLSAVSHMQRQPGLSSLGGSRPVSVAAQPAAKPATSSLSGDFSMPKPFCIPSSESYIQGVRTMSPAIKVESGLPDSATTAALQ